MSTLYIIDTGEGVVKFGVAVSIKRRLRQHRQLYPRAWLLYTMEFELKTEAHFVEAALVHRYRHCSVDGYKELIEGIAPEEIKKAANFEWTRLRSSYTRDQLFNRYDSLQRNRPLGKNSYAQ